MVIQRMKKFRLQRPGKQSYIMLLVNFKCSKTSPRRVFIVLRKLDSVEQLHVQTNPGSWTWHMEFEIIG